ncbi:TetR/AcrR family transcriptional regulator [Actinosynnema sp. NPDC023587]|uniref:TetR/AcrR family transcriptional regulator n=1 Tax=Actinosynnema sp. NPDC023587 TaxID=3154695 RepID=UPI0033C44CFA
MPARHPEPRRGVVLHERHRAQHRRGQPEPALVPPDPKRSPNTAPTRRRGTSPAGIGTLYWHFPTREALLEALLRQRFDLLRAKAEALAGAPPAAALTEWLTEFVARSTTYRGLPESVSAALRDEGSELHTACAAMRGAATGLPHRAQECSSVPAERLLGLAVHGLPPAART